MIRYIVGTGPHARVIADILRVGGHTEARCLHSSELRAAYDSDGEVPHGEIIVGIGDNYTRQRVVEEILAEIPGCRFGVAIHPSAVIAADVQIGAGTVVMAGAVVNTGSTIESHVIVNTRCSVDHDCRLSSFCSIQPGATLAGRVTVGTGASVSVGACVSDGCEIGDYTIVGAGAAVVKTLPGFSICYGVPARVIRAREVG